MKPELRFQGFEDEWEQRKVSELCSISTGNSNTQDKVEDGEYPFYVRSPIIERSTKYLYDEEAVLTVGDGVGTGKVFHYVNGKYDLHQRCYRMYDFTDELNAHYFYHTFSKLFYKRVMAMTAKTSVDSVRLEMIADMEIPSPKIEEQVKIGTCFDNLDNLITLHQRKLEKLKILKKSMLEKMFPKEGESKPEIRFAGFTDDWEQRKVGEVIEDYTEKTVVQNQYPVLTSSQQQGIVLQEDYFADRQVTTNDNIGYYVLPKGYFTYRSRSDTDLFVFNRNNLIDKGIISYYYPVFRPKNADSNFLLRRLNHGMKAQLAMAAEGTGQHVLAHGKFKNMEFLVPSIQEQEQIGACFEKLDNLITLQQRKLEKIKTLKKSMLEKMFPKEGAKE